jgi:hypothetical protein
VVRSREPNEWNTTPSRIQRPLIPCLRTKAGDATGLDVEAEVHHSGDITKTLGEITDLDESNQSARRSDDAGMLGAARRRFELCARQSRSYRPRWRSRWLPRTSARRFDTDGQRADHDERADELDGQQVERRPEVDRQTDTAGEDSDQCCQSRAPWLCERRKLLQYGGAARSWSGPATAGS